MKRNAVYLIIGVVLLILGISRLHLVLLNLLYRSSRWQEMSTGISLVLEIYGLLFVCLAVVKYIFASRNVDPEQRFIDGVTQGYQELFRTMSSSIGGSLKSRIELTWLMAILAIGIALRAYFLAQPMRYDESFTFTNFVNRGVWDLFYYPLPNNHVFHTLLVKAATELYGPHPASIRLPAFLAGIAAIPLTFWLCRIVICDKAGAFAALAMSVYPYMVLYSTTARGYSILVVLVLALLIVGILMSRRISLLGCVLFSLIASLGLLTMPSMLYAIAGVYFWILCLLIIRQNRLRTISYRFLLPSVTLLFVFTFVLYTPTIVASNGIVSIVANPYVQSSPWNDFFGQVAPHSREVMSEVSRDLPSSILLICLVLIVVGTLGALYKRNPELLLLLPCTLIGASIVFVTIHSVPYTRTWIFFLPIAFVTVDAGLMYITERFLHRRRIIIASLSLMIGILYAASLVSRNAVAKYPDTGLFPEASTIVDLLKPMLKNGDAIFAAVPTDDPLMFYLWYSTVSANPTHSVRYIFASGSRQASGLYQNKIVMLNDEDVPDITQEFYVVQKGEYEITDMTEKSVNKLLELPGAVVYQGIAAQ